MKLNLKHGQFSSYADTTVLDTDTNSDYRFVNSGELTTIEKKEYNFTDFLAIYYKLNNNSLTKKENCEHVFLSFTEKEMMNTEIPIDERGGIWNKCIVIDLDFNKNLEFEEYKRDMLLSFLEVNRYNYKLSSSSKGVHIFLQFNDTELTDTQISNLYTYFFEGFSKLLIRIGLNNVPYNSTKEDISSSNFYIIDTNMKNWKTQTLGLSYSEQYKLTSKHVFKYSEIEKSDEFQNIIYNIEVKEKLKLEKRKDYSEIVNTDTLKSEVESIVYRIIENEQLDRVGQYNERITVANLFAWLELKSEFLELKTNYDKKKGVNFESHYKTGLKKEFNIKYINHSLSILNKCFGTKYYHYPKNANLPQTNELHEICIDKYITTEQENVNKIVEIVSKNKNTLIISKTGTGKTDLIIKLIPNFIQNKQSAIFVCDTISLASQSSKSFIKAGYKVCLVESKNLFDENENYDMYISTYDSINRIPESKCSILITDEAHSKIDNINFREKGMMNLINFTNNFKGKVVQLTATPKFMNLMSNDLTVIRITPKFDLMSTNKYFLVKKDEELSRLNQMLCLVKDLVKRNDGKIVLMLNNKEDLEELSSVLSKININNAVVSADTKNEDEYKNIINNSEISDNVQVLFCTKLLQNGINILNNNIKYFITSELEETDFVQSVSRIRKGEVEVFCFGNNNTECVNTVTYHDLLRRAQQSLDFYSFDNNVEELKNSFGADEEEELQLRKADKKFKAYLSEKGLSYNRETGELSICKYKVMNNYKRLCKTENCNNIDTLFNSLNLTYSIYNNNYSDCNDLIQKSEEVANSTRAFLEKVKGSEELIKDLHLFKISNNKLEKEMITENLTDSEKVLLKSKKVQEKIYNYNKLLDNDYLLENLSELEKYDEFELLHIEAFRKLKNGGKVKHVHTRKNLNELVFLYNTTLKYSNKNNNSIQIKSDEYIDFVKNEFNLSKNKNGLKNELEFVKLNKVKDYLKLIFDLRTEHRQNGNTRISDKDYSFLSKKDNYIEIDVKKYIEMLK